MSKVPSCNHSEVSSPSKRQFGTEAESSFSISTDFTTDYDNGSVSAATEDPDLREVFNALLELEARSQPESFQQNKEKIENAIIINEEMQAFAEEQILQIDLMLKKNTSLMNEASQIALIEKRACQPFLIHKRYRKEANYFDGNEVLRPSSANSESNANNETDQTIEISESTDLLLEENESDEDETVHEEQDDDTEKNSKIWSLRERRMLEEGILSEAKRILCLEFVQRNEPWRFWEVEKMDKHQLKSFDVSRLDWQRISSMHVITKTATECLIQWTTQEHPSINKKPWSKQESERLSQLVDEIGLNSGQWELIANRLGTNRTIAQCFSHYMFEKNNDNSKKKWTAEEDKLLARGVKIFGNHNWQMVASIMEGRTGQQCLHRWQKAINPTIIKKKKWSEEEDNQLKRAVQLYGAGQWKKVQRLIPGRTDAQCRERYMNVLHPSLKKEPLTEEESKLLMDLIRQHGTKWSYLARLMPGRTDNFLLKQYKRIIREQQGKKKKKASDGEQQSKAPSLEKEEHTETSKKRISKGKTAKKATAKKAAARPSNSEKDTFNKRSPHGNAMKARIIDTTGTDDRETVYNLRSKKRKLKNA
ncbi:hypothetical protein BDF20DRAFT_901148 [Mycotypha africana]|uniref:uncharacterized protein n=1 Tax=Mycotypha africana TaxID=64632 RepID=UPI002300280A|nr:uncharacterized protein BDF20DRAFT_901148 [Mycotypha africana]KAI8967452.1 hypothetical protein BDF20DRAFT_901148 [Mycotypha africana]